MVEFSSLKQITKSVYQEIVSLGRGKMAKSPFVNEKSLDRLAKKTTTNPTSTSNKVKHTVKHVVEPANEDGNDILKPTKAKKSSGKASPAKQRNVSNKLKNSNIEDKKINSSKFHTMDEALSDELKKGASFELKDFNNDVDNADNADDAHDVDDADEGVFSSEFVEDADGMLLDDDDGDDDDDDDDDTKSSFSHKNTRLPMPSIKHVPSTQLRDNLSLYLREVSKFPLLKPEEEIELTRLVRDTGDTNAAFRIISSHLRLVVRIAMDFQRRWMQNVLDLVQEGNVGLMRAVNKFDPEKGIKFSYYATFWIKAYILKFIMDNWRMVKVGTTQAQRKLFYNLNKERQKLITQGFDPDVNALAEALGVSVEQVVEMQQRLDVGDVSLDLPVNDEHGSATRLDFLPALDPGIEKSYADSEIASLVRNGIAEIMPNLSEKEVFILENRLLTDDPVTLREIGEKYHVTRERIRQLEARLLVKLRNHLGEEIKDFSESWVEP